MFFFLVVSENNDFGLLVMFLFCKQLKILSMDRRYSRRNTEELVVPNYQETSDSYPSPDMWGEWSMNSQKDFDFDVINNGFSGGLYSHKEMEM